MGLFYFPGVKKIMVNVALAVLQIIITIVMGIVAWIFKREFKKTDTTKQDISDFKTKVAEEYVRKDDYNIAQGEILHRLDDIQKMLIKVVTK